MCIRYRVAAASSFLYHTPGTALCTQKPNIATPKRKLLFQNLPSLGAKPRIMVSPCRAYSWHILIPDEYYYLKNIAPWFCLFCVYHFVYSVFLCILSVFALCLESHYMYKLRGKSLKPGKFANIYSVWWLVLLHVCDMYNTYIICCTLLHGLCYLNRLSKCVLYIFARFWNEWILDITKGIK